MDILNIVIFLVIGLILGLLAGLIMRGSGLGLTCDVVAGLVGAVVGGVVVMTFFSSEHSEFQSYAASAIGATLVIMLAAPIKRRL